MEGKLFDPLHVLDQTECEAIRISPKHLAAIEEFDKLCLLGSRLPRLSCKTPYGKEELGG